MTRGSGAYKSWPEVPDGGGTSSAPADPGEAYLAGPAFRADCARIAREVLAARHSPSIERTALRAAVVHCAAGARRAGCLPERFLVELKRSLHARAVVGRGFRDARRERIVWWAIAAYFAAGAGDSGESR